MFIQNNHKPFRIISHSDTSNPSINLLHPAGLPWSIRTLAANSTPYASKIYKEHSIYKTSSLHPHCTKIQIYQPHPAHSMSAHGQD